MSFHSTIMQPTVTVRYKHEDGNEKRMTLLAGGHQKSSRCWSIISSWQNVIIALLSLYSEGFQILLSLRVGARDKSRNDFFGDSL